MQESTTLTLVNVPRLFQVRSLHSKGTQPSLRMGQHKPRYCHLHNRLYWLPWYHPHDSWREMCKINVYGVVTQWGQAQVHVPWIDLVLNFDLMYTLTETTTVRVGWFSWLEIYCIFSFLQGVRKSQWVGWYKGGAGPLKYTLLCKIMLNVVSVCLSL